MHGYLTDLNKCHGFMEALLFVELNRLLWVECLTLKDSNPVVLRGHTCSGSCSRQISKRNSAVH